MKHLFLIAAVATAMISCQQHHDMSEGPRPTKNVILMVPDGTCTGVLALSKWYKHYCGEEDFELNVSDHVCGLMSSTMSNGILSCSAAAMSTIMTGMPQRPGNVSIYPAPDPERDIIEVDESRSYQPLMTVMEASSIMKGRSTGAVVTVEFHHATPAACAAHTPSRGDRKAIARQIASNGVDVVFGGGLDAMDEVTREILAENGVTLIEKDINAFREYDGDGGVWALFEEGEMAYDLDRDPSSAPSLAEMTAKAIEVLSKDKDGFFLMVEGSKMDYAGHANESNALITEFLAFDKAVGVAMDFAKKDGNTTVIVVPDHGNSSITAGKYGYKGYTNKGIDSIYVGMKNYKATYQKLAKILENKKTAEIRPIFREWTGIDLTDKELQSLKDAAGKKESDYMQVANSVNFESAIAKILSSHTNIGFASSGHTSEDVFLAIYHPKGDIPHGILTNTEVNEYLCAVSGLETSLDEMSEKYFRRHDKLFEGYEYEIIPSKDAPVLKVKSGNNEILLEAWKAKVSVNGETHRLQTPSVYIKKNNSFYVSEEVIHLLQSLN